MPVLAVNVEYCCNADIHFTPDLRSPLIDVLDEIAVFGRRVS